LAQGREGAALRRLGFLSKAGDLPKERLCVVMGKAKTMRAIVHNHPVIPREPSSQEGLNGDKLIAEADLVRNIEVEDEDRGHPRVDSLLQIASPTREIRFPRETLLIPMTTRHLLYPAS
jgi:hypothetical protein